MEASGRIFSGKTLEGAVQVGGGVTIPGGFLEKSGRGTQCSGVVDNLGMGHRLDSMVLEAFSNLNVGFSPPTPCLSCRVALRRNSCLSIW